MSEKHLGKDAEKPSKVEGKLRLYGLLFCPYVLRVRLVLLAKGISHDIIYVDLQNKPEWLFELNPKGQVPILDCGDKIISESLDICYYLEENYPQPSLCPKEPERLKNDKGVLRKIDEAINFFYQTLSLVGKKKLKEVLDEAEPTLEYFKNELTARGSFFNGTNAGFIDYMAWPWVEKLPVFYLIFNEEVVIPEKYTNLKNWRGRMLQQEPVKKTVMDIQRHYQYTAFVRQSKKMNVNEV